MPSRQDTKLWLGDTQVKKEPKLEPLPCTDGDGPSHDNDNQG